MEGRLSLLLPIRVTQMEMDAKAPQPEASIPPMHGEDHAHYLIPASTSLHELRPRTLKHGDVFGLFDHNGDAREGPGSPEGVFFRDTRYLSRFCLQIDGRRPVLLSSTPRDDNASLTFDLTNPDFYDPAGELTLEHDIVQIRRVRFLWGGACFERVAVRNFDIAPRRVRLALHFGADFADLFEVRGQRRKATGVQHPPKLAGDSVMLSYTGLDDRRRWTVLRFDPPPDEISTGHACYDLDLAPRETRRFFVEIAFDQKGATESASRSFLRALRDGRRSLRASTSRAASIATSNHVFNETIRRCVSDFYMLVTETPHGLYPYAGVPWFSTVFGRDGLIAGLETLWLDPTIARGVLCYLAAHQARDFDAAADAEPGKILHETRQGEMAVLGEVPFRHYYGSVDSTPLFVLLAGAYFERTGDLAFIRSIWANIEAALRWIETEGDRDGDGFVEYGRKTEEGLVNQGWKDSNDSIFHADGSLARGPIALAEVQSYVYGAWRAAALLARAIGLKLHAEDWQNKADDLQRRFDEVFFDEEMSFYVLALDGDKKPCRVRASNAGHVLLTGLAFKERAGRVVGGLMDRTFFSGWGVRTIASTEARYNPMSYHNGSIWPHDNALIAAGFARYGYRQEAARILHGICAASTYIDLRRLPELFCGFSRLRHQGPTFYPVACAPQAWAAAAPIFLLQSCLGLGLDPVAGQITFERPILPDFLQEVVLRGLKIAGGSVDVALLRDQDEVIVKVLSRSGDIQVRSTS
jgi:glycogen debranching enzyme